MDYGGDEGVGRGRQRKRNSRFKDDEFVQDEMEEEDMEEDDEDMRGPRRGAPARAPVGMVRKGPVGRPPKGNKTCPSCEEPVKPAATSCEYCDYVFTSATRIKEDAATVMERYTFEPEREEDGSLKIEMILGRRRLQPGQATGGHKSNKLPSPNSAAAEKRKQQVALHHRVMGSGGRREREKYCYEYLVKYKGTSYLKTDWLTYHQIEALGLRSKQALHRWLKKQEKGETEEIEDSAFDNSHCVVEKILDCKTTELEVTDDEEEEDEGEEGEPQQQQEQQPPQQQQLAVQVGQREQAPHPHHVNPFVEGFPSGRSWFPMVRCRFVFNKIVEDSFGDWFYEPVDTNLYTDYLDVVERPMCLAYIARELSKPHSYNEDPRLFAADMRLIWANCEAYNQNNPMQAVFQAGIMFQRMFDRLFQAWVMQFEQQNIPWEAYEARPWEGKCMGCRRADDEAHFTQCDFCDAWWHIQCLTPPLPDLPVGPFWCPRCVHMDFEAKANAHSGASEDAWREKVMKALKPRKVISTKLYLVKWKDLGYSACTWERPEHLKDDALIEEYHKINDAPPPEAAIAQEELIQALSKRPYAFAPSHKEGDDLTELEFQTYAQMRAMHFLKYNQAPPQALLKDCGSLCYAFSVIGGDPPKLPPPSKQLRTEVSLALADLVDHVAKGTLPPPPGPPQRTHEYDVTFYRVPKESLSLNIGNYNDRVVIMGFREREDGVRPPLERAERVREEDTLVAINGESVLGTPFNKVIERLNTVGHYMTLRFLSKHQREQAGGTPLQESREHGYRKKMVLPAPVELDGTAGPSHDYSNAIYKTKEYEWGARMMVNGDIVELGKFESKIKAVEAFKANAVKHYGNSALNKYCQGIDHWAQMPDMPPTPTNHLYAAAEDSDYSDDERERGYKDEKNTSSLEELQLWNTSGATCKLIRAVKDSLQRPEKSKWSENLYWEDSPENYTRTLGPGGKQIRWVEQLDANSGVSVRTYESISQASRVTSTPVHMIQQAVANQDIANGFRWRYASDEQVAKQKAIWKQERGFLGADGEDEPWKKKLPGENKIYKDGNKLRDYQLIGVQWLLKCWYQRRSCILADEMGLGKTVQIVAMLEHIFAVDNLPGPFLVVVPLSTIEHWRRELQTWTDMRYCMYYDVGGQRGMRDVMREYEWYYKNRSRRMLKIHVLVTTYEALIKDYEEIAEIPWRTIVVDEAHRLRNWKGKLHECLKVVSQTGMQAYGYQHRVLMTGTPLQNNTQELWSLLHYIEPTKFPDLDRFNERYGRIETPEQVQMLQKRLEPHLLRRTKEDVASDIPPKEETIIDVELTTLQKQYYRAIFERNHTFLYNKAGMRGVLPKLMNIQMELRKCCNHPFLVDGVEDAELEKYEEIARSPLEVQQLRMERGLIASSGKMVLIDKLLPKLRREGHKVLIFSQMIRVLDLLEEFCDRRGFPCERLDGRVTGNQRQLAIDRFNTQVESFVFLLSTRAGGVGINLTAADTVIIFDSDWNPQNDVQAQARCHRIGQTKEVSVYRLITRKSFEAEMFERANRKLGLEHAVLGGHNFRDEDAETQQQGKAPTNRELEQLLRQGAYALLEDDNEGGDEFCEDDIDKIMKERTHRIVMEAGGRNTADWFNKKDGKVKKKVFTVGDGKQVEVDVNDPDFWAKVMPDLKTPETLSKRFDELMSSATPDNTEKLRSFFADLESMCLRLVDLYKRSKCPQRDREGAAQLCLRVSLNEQFFTPAQREIATSYRSQLEGPRVRACRQDFGDNSDDDGAAQRRRRKAQAQAPPPREETHSDVCVLCGMGGQLLCCDGLCHRSFHIQCLQMEAAPKGPWKCPDCSNEQQLCLVCKKVGEAKGDVNAPNYVMKCRKANCGRFYHVPCLKDYNANRWFKGTDKFICPQHMCRECLQRPNARSEKDNFFLQCIHCPSALHLKCALGRPVTVLTYRSMVCDAHAHELEAQGKVVPPLELKHVEHIKAPPRKPRAKSAGLPGRKGKRDDLEDEDDEDFEDDEDEEVDMSDDDGKVRKGRKSGGAKATPKTAGGAAGGPGRKKAGGAGMRVMLKPKLILPYTSPHIGPFFGKDFRIEFAVVRGPGDPREDDEEEEYQAPYNPAVRIAFQRVAAEIDLPEDDDQGTLGAGGGRKRTIPSKTGSELDLGSLASEGDASMLLKPGPKKGGARKKPDTPTKGGKRSGNGGLSSDEGTMANDDGYSEEDRPRKGHPKKDRQSYCVPAQEEEEEEDEGFEQTQETGEMKLYCICRQPERDGDEYLQCDACTEWFHPQCMGLSARDMDRIRNEKIAWKCLGCSGAGSGDQSQQQRARRLAKRGASAMLEDEESDVIDDEDFEDDDQDDYGAYNGGGKKRARTDVAGPGADPGAGGYGQHTLI